MTAIGVVPAVGRVIYTQAQIAAAIERLARAIAADHRGQLLILLGVLKGGVCLISDLARALSAVPGGPRDIMVGTSSSAVTAVRWNPTRRSNFLAIAGGRSKERPPFWWIRLSTAASRSRRSNRY